MKWILADDGSYDEVFIKECEPRSDCNLPRLVAKVFSPALALHEPSEDDRAEMLRAAKEIVDSHNAKLCVFKMSYDPRPKRATVEVSNRWDGVVMQKPMTCPDCKGFGQKPSDSTELRQCLTCRGSGYVVVVPCQSPQAYSLASWKDFISRLEKIVGQ